MLWNNEEEGILVSKVYQVGLEQQDTVSKVNFKKHREKRRKKRVNCKNTKIHICYFGSCDCNFCLTFQVNSLLGSKY